MATTTTRRSKGTRSKAKTTASSKPSTKKKATRRKATTRRKASTKRKVSSKSKRTLTGTAPTISKDDFGRGAKQLHLKIESGGKGAAEFDLDPREFSSGSYGWFASEKFDVPVGTKKVRCQLSFNVTVIGSKNSR